MNPPPVSPEVARLRTRMTQLQEAVRALEKERDLLIQRRFRRLLYWAVGLSMLMHVCLMIYLAMTTRGGGGFGGDDGGGRSIELAILNEEELLDIESVSDFEELETAAASDFSTDDFAPNAINPDSGLASAAATSDLSLGATGSGAGGAEGAGAGGLGLGGGGGSASFFGTGGKGQRFAYIVDISGSMGQQRKLEIALKELARSIAALPDFASFYILLFESKTVQPPMQNGWIKARKATVRQVSNWLSDVQPNGGTEPRTAFLQVFALDVRPDTIFFLTDGIFTDINLEELIALNAHGKKAVINTVGFGAPGEVDQSLLRAIASQSGGQYRFVTTEANP